MAEKPSSVKATYERNNVKFTIQLKLMCWDEDGIHYTYSPALDLTGYGKTDIEATKSFEVSLKEFINYTHNKKTFYSELERLGWTTNKNKKRVSPPDEKHLLEDNETYKELSTREGVRTSNRNIGLALA